MAGKADFTRRGVVAALPKSPMMAGLVIVAASPSGPFGVIKEMIALGKLVAETKAKGGGDALVGALVVARSPRARASSRRSRPTSRARSRTRRGAMRSSS